MKIKFSFDSNIYDAILNDGNEFLERLIELIEKGTIEIYKTHIQDDEHREMLKHKPEKFNKIEKLKLRFNINHTITSGAVWGESKWDECKWDDTVNGVNLTDLNYKNHCRDALIALSAHEFVDYLITNDKDLIKRCETKNIKVLDFLKFKAFIKNLN
ncbi:MAG: hypothetical protein RBU23_05870 [Candidatus Auribacterota bacterium]|nr:hypothetical protein [Candidatus Auribacterota bacterium]